MIIFLYGNDVYRRTQKVRELLRLNREKRKDADIAVFDLSEEKNNWKSVKEFLEQPSMFSETKTAVIYECDAIDIKEWRELLKKEIETQDHILIISNTNTPKKNFSFLLNPPVRFSEFGELSGKNLELFLKQEAGKRGIAFEKKAWIEFVDSIQGGTAPSAIGIQELEKLSLLFKNKTIHIEEIKLITHATPKQDVFGLAKQIMFEKNPKKRLEFLEIAFLNNIDEAYLFNMLAVFARGQALETIATLDVKIKSGEVEYSDALAEFVLKK